VNDETLLEFPCLFPIKVMGNNHADFEQDIVKIIHQHITNIDSNAVKSKPSRTGKYLAVTVTITATSKAQLDQLYKDLHAHPDVKMML